MKKQTLITVRIFLIFAISVLCSHMHAQNTDSNKIVLKPILISYNIDSSAYQELLSGPPETSGMYSGLVTLMPGDTVGHHNTEIYEELLVIISGEGKMLLEGNKSFALKKGVVAYCPPHTEHDVKNDGTFPLKYIYIAFETKK
jgi:quercetin dioxygenase-like cupin family protein